MAAYVVPFTGITAAVESGNTDFTTAAAGWGSSFNGSATVALTATTQGLSGAESFKVTGTPQDDGGLPITAILSSVVLSFDVTASRTYVHAYSHFDDMPWIDTPTTVDVPSISGGLGPDSTTLTHTFTGITTRAALFAMSGVGWSFAPRLVSGQTWSDHNTTYTIANFKVVVTYSLPGPPPPAPALNNLRPASGAATGGQTVTLYGQGFTGAPAPTFDGIAVTSYAVISDAIMTCVPAPHAAGAVDVAIVGVGSLLGAYRYVEKTDNNVISGTAAPNLPPIPSIQPPIDPRTSKIDGTWLRWLNALKQRVEAVVGADASQIVTGLFNVAQIPVLPWSRIDKAGSSLADLETTNAADLNLGTIRDARLADTAVTPGSYGDATHSASVTVDQKGRVTAASQTAIATLPATVAKGDMLASTGSAFGIEPIGANGNILTADSTKTRGVTWASPPGGTVPGTANKGDVLSSNGSAFVVRHVGADGTVLTADSSQSDGVKWAVPGALILLEEHTAAASASLDFTTAITSTYDEYVFELVNVVPTTNTDDLWSRVSTNAGVSYDSSANYWYAASYAGSNAAGGAIGAESGAQWKIATSSLSNTAAAGGVSGHLRIFSPLSASLHKQYIGQTTFLATDGHRYVLNQGGSWTLTTAVNAIRFVMSTGTIASGTIRCYGVAK